MNSLTTHYRRSQLIALPVRQLDAHRELSDIGNLVVASQTLKHAVLLLSA